MNADDEKALVQLLAALRREGRQQSGLDPRLTPPDAPTAYRIAGKVADALGWPVVGWKIAATNARMQAALRSSEPIYGRVYDPNVVPSPASVAHSRQLSPIPEVEFVFRLTADLPPREEVYSEDEVADAVASLHPGLELAECRFIHDDAFPPLPAILADGSGNGTLVVGDAVEDWRSQPLSDQDVRLIRDGEVCRTGNAREAMGHPLKPLTWLANALSRTKVGLKEGQWVSTGTLTGMLRPKAGQTFVADFGAFGRVQATYE